MDPDAIERLLTPASSPDLPAILPPALLAVPEHQAQQLQALRFADLAPGEPLSSSQDSTPGRSVPATPSAAAGPTSQGPPQEGLAMPQRSGSEERPTLRDLGDASNSFGSSTSRQVADVSGAWAGNGRTSSGPLPPETWEEPLSPSRFPFPAAHNRGGSSVNVLSREHSGTPTASLSRMPSGGRLCTPPAFSPLAPRSMVWQVVAPAGTQYTRCNCSATSCKLKS